MIKYYSTLTNTLHNTEKSAQTAEDKYIEEHFENLSKRAAQKRRKLRHLADRTDESQIKVIFIS